MQLLTKRVQKTLPALYSQEDAEDPMVQVKFFNPDGAATWYITEGSPVDHDGDVVTGDDGKTVAYDPAVHRDFLFFGLCDLGLGFPELGTVALSELTAIRTRFGLGIERDLYFEPAPLSTFQK